METKIKINMYYTINAKDQVQRIHFKMFSQSDQRRRRRRRRSRRRRRRRRRKRRTKRKKIDIATVFE